MSQIPNFTKFGIIGLSAILAITIIPFNDETNSNDGKFYGLLTLVNYDENGNEVFSQSVHNRLVNTGETFLLQASFREGTTAPLDNTQIAAICIADAVDEADEDELATDFDTLNTIAAGTNGECIVDSAVDITTTQGTAIIGPETFTGGTHLLAGQTISGIGICQSNGAAADYALCASAGVLFAVINTGDVTLAGAETVQITYTFDITSPND
jgi:hypothetical protein